MLARLNDRDVRVVDEAKERLEELVLPVQPQGRGAEYEQRPLRDVVRRDRDRRLCFACSGERRGITTGYIVVLT